MKVRIISILCLISFVLIISCQSDDQLEFDRYYSSGMVVYQSKCQNCHGVKGEGLLGLIPPLTDSLYLKVNKNELACIIKYGLNKQITINGKAFQSQMPANDFPPVAIAEVLTYITNSFGNKLGVVTSQQVNAAIVNCR